MKDDKQINQIVLLRNFAYDLALALADEAMYVESLSRDGSSDPPSENTLKLLARARVELGMQKQFDELDSMKPLFDRLPRIVDRCCERCSSNQVEPLSLPDADGKQVWRCEECGYQFYE